MSAVDYIVLGVVATLVALAIAKIVKDKEKGVKCSGCGECSKCSTRHKDDSEYANTKSNKLS